MGAVETISLFLVMAIGALIPSSSVVLVVARSLSHGIPNGISVSLGIILGDLIFIVLVIFGLSVIAETMGWLFLAIKYIGAAYLIWLGYTLLFSRSTMNKVEPSSQKGNLVASFLAGLFLTLGDVKAIFFYISLFPAFINLGELTFIDILVIMLIDIVTVGGVKIFYAFSAEKVASISKGCGLENKTRKAAGGFMLGVGSYIIVKT
ncbi:MAG: LysE family translocator [Gammaproteobacteria bacterium]|nr:LysE family translocator [Gammaproteobacteria bacterium]